MKQKYIITSGCSYGRFGISLSYLIRNSYVKVDNDIDLIVLDLHSQSQSANYISDAIIYTVDFLIKNKNVDPSDISVITEWTEIERIAFFLPHYIDESIKEETYFVNTLSKSFRYFNNRIEYVDCSEDFHKLNLDGFDIKWYRRYPQLPSINNALYYTPHHIDPKDYKDTPIYIPFKENGKRVFRTLEHEFLIHNFFDCLLKTQFYLDKLGISYKFTSIYNNFSSLKKTDQNFITDKKEPRVRVQPDRKCIDNKKKFEEYKKRTLNEKSRIDNVFPQIKPKFDLIDFSKWWFYEEDMKYGGIDEYAMSKFNLSGYIKNKDIDTNLPLNLPKFTNHPTDFVYDFILLDILKDTIDYLKINVDSDSLLLKKIEELKSMDMEISKKINLI